MFDTPRTKVILGVTAVSIAIQFAPALSWFFPVTKHIFPNLMGVNPRGTSITFDDGPDIAFTPQILDILDNADVKATFFMLGKMVEDHPSVAKQVANRGHNIAMHGYEHKNHLFRSPRTILYDLSRAKSIIEETTGQTITLYRPPYGVISIGTILAARRLDLKILLWTTWGRDWRKKASAKTVLDDLLRHGVVNATVLLHDSDCTSSPGSTWATIGSLNNLINHMRDQEIKITH